MGSVGCFGQIENIRRQSLYRSLSEATGTPMDKIARDADRNYWMDAQEALNYGMIDRIISK